MICLSSSGKETAPAIAMANDGLAFPLRVPPNPLNSVNTTA